MSDIAELFLDGYLRFSTAVCNERVVSELPYNEALICNLLYRKESKTYTATELCEKTRMKKSQMARTLNEMEEKGLIIRKPSKADRRLVLIELKCDNTNAFFRQHAMTLKIMDAIGEKMSVDRLRDFITLLNEAADAAREVLG